MNQLVSLISERKLRTVCDNDSLQFIQKCSDNLPFSSYGGFELRLGSKSKRIDFGLNYRQYQRPFETNKFTNKYWEDFQNLVLRWNKKGTIENIYINDMWVELDYMDKMSEASPIMFCTLRSLPGNNFSEVIKFIESAFNTNLSDSTKKSVSKFLRMLPGGAVISHIAYMNSRPHHPLRFNIKELEVSLLENILSEMGFAGVNKMIKKIREYALLSDSFTLAADVSNAEEGKIGIEFFFKQQTKGYYKLEMFLDKLAAEGLMDGKLRQVIDNWPSIEVIDPALNNYPDELLRLSRFLYPEGICTFWNIVNHLKLVFHNDAIEAKAYLMFGHSCDLAES